MFDFSYSCLLVFSETLSPRNTGRSESRQAANEAVEAALNSADADREEACAELEAVMKEKVYTHWYHLSLSDCQGSSVIAATCRCVRPPREKSRLFLKD